MNQRYNFCLLALITALGLVWLAQPAHAYVEAPQSLGSVIAQSTNILLMRVDKVDKVNNRIIFVKIQDIKGKPHRLP